MLAIDDPLADPNSSGKKILWIIETIFTLLFTIEMLLKIVSMGFVWNPDFD